MQFKDAVNLTTGPASGWQAGQEQVSLTCATKVVLQDVCEEDNDNTLIAGGDSSGLYETRPVGISATLGRAAGCPVPDNFLSNGLKDVMELAVSRALVTTPETGFGEDAVWIGHADVATQAYATSLAASINAARTKWFTTVFGAGNKPVLHLSPHLAIGLAGNLLQVTGVGETVTIWGDDVVMAAGYDGSNIAFWAGEIKVTILPVEETGNVYDASTNRNRVLNTANTVALVDVAPCTIVRITSIP